jgi:hypothetical protein
MPPKKLWQRRLADGALVEACLWRDVDLAESTIELSISGVPSEDTLATSIADAVRAALDERGAVPI